MAIDHIANGEAGAPVRAKLNSVIDRANYVDAIRDGQFAAQNRPGEAPVFFTEVLSGEAGDISQIGIGSIVTTDRGLALRVPVPGAPVNIVQRPAQRVDAGQVYVAQFAVQRSTNTPDPYGDAVEFRLACLDKDKTFISSLLVQRRALTVADARYAAGVTFSLDQPADQALTAGTRYVRPYIRLYGAGGVTDIELLGVGSPNNGLPGPKGDKGDEPEYQLDVPNELIRWRQPDGTWGPWLDIGSARKKAEAARDESQALRDITAGYASTAAANENSDIFGVAAGLAALTIPTGFNFIRTSGYYAAGDGGAALYRLKGAGEAAAPGDRLTNGSAKRWGLVPGFTVPEAFGASPTASRATNSQAFKDASDFLAEGDTLYCAGVTYPLIGPVDLKAVNISGQGSGATIFEFDNATQQDGFVFRTPLSMDVGYGVEFATIRTINGHGRDAISTSKDAHNGKKPKPRFQHLAFAADLNTDTPDSFAVKWSWRWALHLGDAWDLTIEDIDMAGSFIVPNDPAPQFKDGFVRFNPTQGILSGRMRDITTHNVANGIEIRRKTYISGSNIDIARAWQGFYDAPDREFETNRYAYGESNWNFIVINAQLKCIDLANRFATTFKAVALHRAGNGFNHGATWIGLRLDDSTACSVDAVEAAVGAAFSGEAVGIWFAGGVAPILTNYHAGGNLTHSFRASGRASDAAACQAPIVNNVALQANSQIVFDLVEARGARLCHFTKSSGNTFDTFVQYGNVSTQQSCFFMLAPTDNSIEFDDDFFWVRPNGGANAKRWRWNATDTAFNLGTQADNLGVGVNALLFQRSGTAVTRGELRAQTAVLGGTAANVISYVPSYADNAAAVAAGLPQGALYRTGDAVKIVHV